MPLTGCGRVRVQKKNLNIIYQPGFYGNFLRFVCEKFSRLCADIQQNPFLPNGTAHNYENIRWSGLFNRQHLDFFDNANEKDAEVCLIRPVSDIGRLLSKTLTIHRAGKDKDRTDIDDIFKLPKKDLHISLVRMYDDICEFYGLGRNGDVLPKYLVRDWFKLEWLADATLSYDQKLYGDLLDRPTVKEMSLMTFPLESFLDWNSFQKQLILMDEVFDLSIDFDRQDEMIELFEQGLSLDKERGAVKSCLEMIQAIENKTDQVLPRLNVILESFIMASVEKQNENFIFPLTDHFYSSTKEIIQLIQVFPNYYKMVNPHLKNEQK